MTRVQLHRGTSWTVLLAFFTTLTACGGKSEEAPPPTTLAVPSTAPPAAVPTTAPPPTMPAQPPDQLSKQQLQELVAPVALYPDVVLASLLPATTYPDQVADAAGWLRQQNGQVQGVPDDRNWDGSVAGLLQFPDVLNWLDQNDPWEEQMGSAMTYQQGDVLQAIQDYRQLALDAGNLKSNEYMKVEAQPNQDIRIAPAQPDTVYVPQYDTAAVTEPQEKSGINPWLAFGGGAAVGALGAWALYSIFDDDDDDDDHHHGGGGHNKKVKVHDNVYYGRGRRPPAGDWNARPRPGRPGGPGNNQIARPRPVDPVYSTRPTTKPAGEGGVRPPQRRPGQGGGGGGQVARPTPAPGGATPVDMQSKQGGGKGGGQGKKGGGQGAGKQKDRQQATPAPSVRQGSATTGKPQAAQQAAPQKKQGGGGGQKKQGGGGGGGGQKKKKKKGGGSN